MLIDSHCHLDRLKLDTYPDGLTQALAEARARDISGMLCVCISEDNKQAVLDIAAQYDDIWASVGIHPCDVSDAVVAVDTLLSWCDESKVVAVGETGLDYYHSQECIAQQQQSFANHMIAAGEKLLPVIVHTREARTDTITMIREHAHRESSGVLHCFTETIDMAKQALDLNFYISLSGIVTFKNALELKEVAKYVPLDRLLVETDSPYLAPVPYRGKPNEPKYVREVAEYIAELRGISFEELAKATTENFYRLFGRANG